MQLVFNNSFDKIEEEKQDYKTIDEISENIINFINNITNTRIIYDFR